MRWLHGLGMRYRLMYERQAYEGPDGRLLFFGGLHVGNVDGGVGLMADHTRIAERLGVEVRYGTAATGLVTDGRRVVGVRATAATDRSRSSPVPSCSPPAGSRPTPSCAAGTSARAGSGPGCGARRSTRAT